MATLRLMNKWILEKGDRKVGQDQFVKYFFLKTFQWLFSVTWKVSVDLGKGQGASLVFQMVKNLPAMQETQVRFLGQEDPLGKRVQSLFQEVQDLMATNMIEQRLEAKGTSRDLLHQDNPDRHEIRAYTRVRGQNK